MNNHIYSTLFKMYVHVSIERPYYVGYHTSNVRTVITVKSILHTLPCCTTKCPAQWHNCERSKLSNANGPEFRYIYTNKAKRNLFVCLLTCLSMAGHALCGMAPCFGHTGVTFDTENDRPGTGASEVILRPPKAVCVFVRNGRPCPVWNGSLLWAYRGNF